jgi:hypothetical protein
MKVETKFHPITITLETAQEFDFMWDALEQAYETYPIDSPIRNFLIDASNSMSEVHSVQPSVEEINELINAAVEEDDDERMLDDQSRDIWK